MRTQIPSKYVAAYQRREMTVYDISELIGKSPSTVYNALFLGGVDTGTHRKRLENRNKKVVDAYQANKGTLEEIGKMFGGISKQRVKQIIDREFETLTK